VALQAVALQAVAPPDLAATKKSRYYLPGRRAQPSLLVSY